MRRSNEYQFYSLWFDLTRARTHDLPHLGVNHYTTDAVKLQVGKYLHMYDNKKNIQDHLSDCCQVTFPITTMVEILIFKNDGNV
jgi:hypothetical protein